MKKRNVIKKVAAVGLSFMMLVGMTACGGSYSSDLSAQELAESVQGKVAISDATNLRDNLVEDSYGADLSFLEDFYVLKSSEGVTPDEIAVFKVKDTGDLSKCTDAFKTRQEYQKTNFESYKPDQMYKFDNVYTGTFGVYAVMVIADDTSDVKAAVEEALK